MPLSLRLALLLALALPSCSDDSDASKPGAADDPCADRKGSYLIHYAEQANGTCGPVPDQVINFSASTGGGSNPCKGDQTLSDDNCTIESDIVCPEPGLGEGFTSHNVGTVRWSEDGLNGEGTISIEVFSPAKKAECRSVYKLTYTKQ